MPRRTADQRHLDTTPPDTGPDLVDRLVALHHPTRRRIFDELTALGQASVGQLARATGLAVGSVSHHLKPLHRAGFVEPAPDLARDTRESWWRPVSTSLSFDADALPPGSRARAVAEVAERANDDWHVAAIRAWRSHRSALPAEWRRAGGSTDTTVAATSEQLADLCTRLDDLLREWSAACRRDADERPDEDRRAVIVLAHAAPRPVALR